MSVIRCLLGVLIRVHVSMVVPKTETMAHVSNCGSRGTRKPGKLALPTCG